MTIYKHLVLKSIFAFMELAHNNSNGAEDVHNVLWSIVHDMTMQVFNLLMIFMTLLEWFNGSSHTASTLHAGRGTSPSHTWSLCNLSPFLHFSIEWCIIVIIALHIVLAFLFCKGPHGHMIHPWEPPSNKFLSFQNVHVSDNSYIEVLSQ